ncbi:MAG: hypothetical protein ABS46_17455 [Cytophagaceae bacterium SCN 52-12]|nr:MAG: hypothetical protein ABS46_17455 [Cytophagaceae bacterium SCN 52-12]
MLSQIISVLILAATSVFVIFNQLPPGKSRNRIIIFLFSLLFLLPSVLYLLPEKNGGVISRLLVFSYSLENTVAYVLLIVLCWSLTMLSDAGLSAILAAIVLSALLMWATHDPQWRPLQSVVRSFCVLVSMVIATFALVRRQKNGVWMVVALMSLAFALKPQLTEPLLGSFESHNYLKAIALFCIARAVSSGGAQLFRK